MAYDTKMNFVTLYKPSNDSGKTLATGIVDVEQVKEKLMEIFNEIEEAGKTKIRIQVMPASKGKGDFWLGFSCPPDKQTSTAPDEKAPEKGSGWG